MSFASKTDYRHDVRHLTELNWNKSNSYQELQDQWCLDYMLRSRDYRGSGVGCFVLTGLLECFAARFDDGMLWLLLAGGFQNRNTLSLYMDVGFLVTSLDSDKTPIMSLHVQDIGPRARKKVVDTLKNEAPGLAWIRVVMVELLVMVRMVVMENMHEG